MLEGARVDWTALDIVSDEYVFIGAITSAGAVGVAGASGSVGRVQCFPHLNECRRLSAKSAT